MTKGGAGRGQGRKPLSDVSPSVTVSLRLTKEQQSKLKVLGGGAWVRVRIDEANISQPPQDKN